MLDDLALPCSTLEELRGLCMVASNADEEIADIVSRALAHTGLQGVVNIEESARGRNEL